MNKDWDWSNLRPNDLKDLVPILNGRMKNLERALRAPKQPFLPRYGPTVTPDFSKSDQQKIVVTDGVAWALGKPANMVAGRPNDLQVGEDFFFDILNASGGAMGVVTFDPIYRIDASYANPANGKRRTARFYYDGTSCVQLGAWSGDL